MARRSDVHDQAVGGPDGDTWGPELERRGGRGLGRLIRWSLLILLVLLLAFPWMLSARIPSMPVDNLASRDQPMHVLVVGSDSREGLSRDEMVELSTGFDDGGGERTDTIMLMTIQGGDVALLSFPRDLWVERCDGSMGRINVAIGIDGPGCVVETVRRLSGIDVQHYVGVTFGGFRDVVDAVDGVEICLEEPISDRDAGIDLAAGCQTLQGPDALGYVRVRKIDNDLMRVKRQQTFLQALAREVAEPATLFNPVRLWRLSGSAGQAVTFDDSLGPVGLARLGIGARGLAGGGTPTHTVPVTPRTTSGGAAVLDPVTGEAEALFARFRDGSVLRENDEEAISPADIRVEVANGAGVDGLAGRIAEMLTDRGYEVVGVGNADIRDRSVIRHPPGEQRAAERLRSDIPGGATLEETSEVTTPTVVLGRDAGGVG
ncbi:MAG: LCP family protein [Nitriliruptoraceae bacterium]|nr:LCP family protein [Nitriliruptoraceae bacterium]